MTSPHPVHDADVIGPTDVNAIYRQLRRYHVGRLGGFPYHSGANWAIQYAWHNAGVRVVARYDDGYPKRTVPTHHAGYAYTNPHWPATV